MVDAWLWVCPFRHVRISVTMQQQQQVARWDRDMTGEGAPGSTEGVLPTLRAAEDTLLRAEDKCARVDGLLQLQEVRPLHTMAGPARMGVLWDEWMNTQMNGWLDAYPFLFVSFFLLQRYRQDSSGLQARMRALYEAVAEEDASQTDLRRQQMHERSQAVFAGVKRLKERVRKAQAAYRGAGISLAAAGSVGAGPEEGLSQLRGQVRKLTGRLHRLGYRVEEEREDRRKEGRDGGEAEEGPPPTDSAM